MRAAGHERCREHLAGDQPGIGSTSGRWPGITDLPESSDPHLTPTQVALGYKNLLEAKRGFRDMKSTLMLRPVFHRLEARIRAHVLICWLALPLVRVAANHTGTTWDRSSNDMDRLAAVTLIGPAGTVVQATDPPTPNATFLAPATCPPHPGSPR